MQAGILLGPSGLSRYHTFERMIFPLRSWVHLDHISLLAIILFTFSVAVKTDLSLIRKSGRKAYAVAHVGTAIPFLSIFVAVLLAHPALKTNPLVLTYIIHFTGRWALTSYIVISSLLSEFNLLATKLGRLAISASLIADTYSAILSFAFLFVATLVQQSVLLAMTFICSCIGFVLSVWLMARPVAMWIVRRTPEGSPINESFFLVILLMAIGSSIAGELVGQSITFGPILLGIMMPGGPPLGTAVADRLDRLVSALLLPSFMFTAGLRCDLRDVVSGTLWTPMTYLISISVAFKFLGIILSCMYCKMSFRDGFLLALILNSRGIIEISTFNNLEDFNDLSGELYGVNVVGIIAVGGASAALLKLLYRPSNRRPDLSRRTVQSCQMDGGELRMLSCVHCENNVPLLLSLISSLSPSPASPLCVYLLLLSPLVGRNSAVLSPYRKKQRTRSTFCALFSFSSSSSKVKSAATATVSDRIISSLLTLERHYPADLLSLQPYICVSPYETMHDDVCTIASDKLCDLILLPFHRRTDVVEVPLESVSPAVRVVNSKVLQYAPCSVAILIDRGWHAPVQRTAVFFLGGADDREALAVASRMRVESLFVLRLVMPPPLEGQQSKGREEVLDEEALLEFAKRMEGGTTVYRKEKVREGADAVRLLREMSQVCELLIVGRGEGRVSPITAGLEMWSEYPELGLLGDVLASKDFGANASSVLVVQQRSSTMRRRASKKEPPPEQLPTVAPHYEVLDDIIVS